MEVERETSLNAQKSAIEILKELTNLSICVVCLLLSPSLSSELWIVSIFPWALLPVQYCPKQSDLIFYLLLLYLWSLIQQKANMNKNDTAM